MNLKAVGQTASGCGIMIAVLLGTIFLGAICFSGAVWVTEHFLPALAALAVIDLAICVVLLLPLTLIRPTRHIGAFGLFLSSYLFATVLWMEGFTAVLVLWGIFPLIIGLVFFGVGVVPLGIIAEIFHGAWGGLGEMVMLLALTIVLRAGSAYALSTVDK